MRPIFVGNFEYETRQSDLEKLFGKYGRVDRVDIKSDLEKDILQSQKERSLLHHKETELETRLLQLQTEKESWLHKDVGSEHQIGFAFVYFEDERDAEDAINALDNTAFGYDRRKLSVEWARGERNRHRDGSKSVSNQRPTKTLFVINFDPVHTRVRDIEKHFEPYGKILHVRIRRNFAFVQFETQEEATKALECTHMSKVLDRVVSVEYALRDDGERGDRSRSPRRDYGRRGDSPIRRSLSPYRRGRPSPDYGRAHSRPSPDYGRAHSPVYDTYNGPSSHGRPRSPGYDRYRSRSPVRRSRS